MPTTRVFPQWREDFSRTKYPFADTALLTNNQGDFFTEGVLLDAAFYPIGGQSRMYISGVEITAEECTLTIGDSATQSICTGTFTLLAAGDATPDDETDALIHFYDKYDRPAGVIVSTPLRLATFQAWLPGIHTFSLGATELAARCCQPTPEIGVRGFLLDDGTVCAGDTWLVGDDGIVLQTEDRYLKDNCGTPVLQRTVVFNVVGDPLYRRRLCQNPTFFQTPRFIKTIIVRANNEELELTPDAYGEFKILVGSNLAVDTVLRVQPVSGGLIIGAVGEHSTGRKML